MIEKPSKLQPALVGGLTIGVLSSIPLVSAGNICCCLWVLLGGAIASRMMVKRSPHLPITTGEGAEVGALAGVVSAGVILVIGVPLNLLFSTSNSESMRQFADSSDNPAIREAMLQVTAMMEEHVVLFALLTWFVTSIIYIAFATVGGMIGVALFEKRKGQQPPPPAPDYGGPGYSPPGPPPGGPSWPSQSPYEQDPPPPA
ncbi:MAG: hypothetical protein WAU45_01155 [Blastocatellia bacterium]